MIIDSNRVKVIASHLKSSILSQSSFTSSSQQQQQQKSLSSNVDHSQNTSFSSIPVSHQSGPSYQLSICFSEPVREALTNGDPVVALESTIISHGMPYPQNVETAKRVEKEIMDHGAVPATIAILDGTIHVGLTDDQLETLGKLGKDNVIKCSRRDLPMVCAKRLNGATTVSATMIVADMVGIKIFVTGGIGGVHRGVEETMDVSADLTELGRTNVCVVCAGVKSILDIGKTLEYLETQGVCVSSYQTDEFPSFFTSKSGFKSHVKFDTPLEVASVIQSSINLNYKGGMICAVPIPKNEEAKASKIDKAIAKALNEANKKNIKGKDVTPFLLKRINEITKGDSLKSNIALVLNNARVGAQVAKELSKIQKNYLDEYLNTYKVPLRKNNKKICVIGGAALDITGFPRKGLKFHYESSNIGEVQMSSGGVASNIACVLSKLDVEPILISAIGDDQFGNVIKKKMNGFGVNTEHFKVMNSERSAVYFCMQDEKGDLIAAIADMDIFHKGITSEYVSSIKDTLEECSFVLFDGNIHPSTMKTICNLCEERNILTIFDATSVHKSSVPYDAGCLHQISFIKPNEDEIFEMARHILQQKNIKLEMKDWRDCAKVLIAHGGAQNILLTRGKEGVAFCTSSNAINNIYTSTKVSNETQQNDILIHTYKAKPIKRKVNVTGAGDNLTGAFISGLLHHRTISQSIEMGLQAALLCLQSTESIHPQLSFSLL